MQGSLVFVKPQLLSRWYHPCHN